MGYKKLTKVSKVLFVLSILLIIILFVSLIVICSIIWYYTYMLQITPSVENEYYLQTRLFYKYLLGFNLGLFVVITFFISLYWFVYEFNKVKHS